MPETTNKDPHGDGGQPEFEYSQIDENVFIGTNACCSMHFNEGLIEKGITVDISLEGEKLDQPYGVDIFIWIPTEDHTPPKRHCVRAAIEALDALLKDGKKIYIHCKNGHGRAPTFYSAYLILKKGLTPEQAVEKIREKRPSIHLEEGQLEFLRSLTK